MKKNKLVIVGDSAFAEVAYEYFTHDSDYEVVGFSVEAAFLRKETLFGLPVVSFEDLHETFNPGEYDLFVAIVYTQLNRLRARLCSEAKKKGFNLASYVSSKAFVWRNVQLGENCFIFENNIIQPFVHIGNDVILWSGNHIGHHSVIGDHCFFSSHVVVSGFVEIGEYCFLGVNSTIVNNVKVMKDCWVGPSVVIIKDTERGLFYRSPQPQASKVSTYHYFKIKE